MSFQQHARIFANSNRQMRQFLDGFTRDQLVDIEEFVLNTMEQAYMPAKVWLPSDFMSYGHFLRVVSSLEMSSSPGYPYCLQAPTNGSWLGFDGLTYNQIRLAELWSDLQLFLEGELRSTYRAFVKVEPHKISKARSNKWRLIICSPLYEQVAWTMVFGTLNDEEVDKAFEIPSVQGMKLCNGDWKHWVDIFDTRGYDASIDKSSWDWTVTWWLIDLERQFRERMIMGPDAEYYNLLAQDLYRRAFISPNIIFSSGCVYQQLNAGLMKSGCVNTISANSHMQIMVHILLNYLRDMPVDPLPIACGDDTLSSGYNTPLPEDFERLGIIVKNLDYDTREFVGHQFPGALSSGPWLEPIPLYTQKHIFRFTMVNDEDLAQFLDSMCREYCHHPIYLQLWYDLANIYGVPLYSRKYYQFWFDKDVDSLGKTWITAILSRWGA
uniref:RNA-directed RNA polymerase C-terminal domain-containing protein n=1 Tax=Riboviria sp. TaxID=2585031 RepID=A0A8K1U2C3_9VIRU|nr:MAG: hypothetical protein 2 [Riboviria sp.]